MTWRRARSIIVLSALAIALGTCTDPQEPTPGWVNLRVTTPNTDDGGMIFTVSGPAVDSVRSSIPGTFFRQESATQTRVLITRAFSDGTVLAQVFVPDLSNLTGYAAAVVEVAQRAPSFLQQSIVGYSITVEAPQ